MSDQEVNHWEWFQLTPSPIRVPLSNLSCHLSEKKNGPTEPCPDWQLTKRWDIVHIDGYYLKPRDLEKFLHINTFAKDPSIMDKET